MNAQPTSLRGASTLIFEDPREARQFSRRAVGQSVAELERLADGDDGGQFHIPLPHETQADMSRTVGFATQFSPFTPITELTRVLDSVRNALLNWALKLEEDGVLGEGLSFSKEERALAAQGDYDISHFLKNLGRGP